MGIWEILVCTLLGLLGAYIFVRVLTWGILTSINDFANRKIKEEKDAKKS